MVNGMWVKIRLEGRNVVQISVCNKHMETWVWSSGPTLIMAYHQTILQVLLVNKKLQKLRQCCSLTLNASNVMETEAMKSFLWTSWRNVVVWRFISTYSEPCLKRSREIRLTFTSRLGGHHCRSESFGEETKLSSRPGNQPRSLERPEYFLHRLRYLNSTQN